jgi:hypothetical protein
VNTNNSDNKIDHPSSSGLESILRKSMGNIFWEVDKQRFHMINSHYPGLDKKEMCVCLGFCSAIWDTNYSTIPNTVVEFAMHKGEHGYMKENGKPLFTNEEEVKEVIERLKQKGVMWTIIRCAISGFRGECRSRLCPHVFYHLVRYLKMKPQIEDDAWLSMSRSFEGAMQSAFGPIKPEEQ